MKILNVENNKLVAYIQRKNIKAMLRYEEKIPRKFYKFAKDIGLYEQDDTHDEEFIKTTDKKFIKLFLKLLEYIEKV